MKDLRQQRWIVGALLVALLVVLVAMRIISESRSELMTATAYEQDGQPMRALEHYRRTMRWSFPINPYATRANVALRRMAKALEDEGRIEEALLAWRSIAGSLAATRWIYSTTDLERAEAHDEIARLTATHQRTGMDAGADPKQLIAEYRALFEQGARPNPFWGSVLLLGFAAWVGSLAVAASRGFDTTGRLQWATARAPFSGALAGLVAFVLGMLFA